MHTWDDGDWYSTSLGDRDCILFGRIDEWLASPRLVENEWVTEQALHALRSTPYGVEFLPDRYAVSTAPGIAPHTVCKHHPGYFRPLLYEEGMATLPSEGFLDELRG